MSKEVYIEPAPAEDKVKTDALVQADRVSSIVIREQADLDVVNAALVKIDAGLDYFSNLYDKRIAEANSLHKSLVADKRQFTDPLERARKMGRTKVADYLYDEDQKRLAAARERQRAEELAASEAEKAADKAHELIENGKEGKVAAVIEKATEKIEAIKAAAPVIPSIPVADFSMRTTWEFEVTDVDLVPRKYMVPDMTLLGKIVRAMKDQTDIPGIKAYPTRSVASKANRY